MATILSNTAAAAIVGILIAGGSAVACESGYPIVAPGLPAVSTTGAEVHRMFPDFFGFNLEILAFQASLWDKDKARPYADVLNFLSAFPGAVYRYPGGTVANAFNWRGAVGPLGLRPPQQLATWAPAAPVSFGIKEYLDFLRNVKGEGWFVVNIYGALGVEKSAATLAGDAGDLARYLRTEWGKGSNSLLRSLEFGNELDRTPVFWPPQKYVERAREIMQAMRPLPDDVQTVAMAQDYDALKTRLNITAVDYNKYVSTELGKLSTTFSAHVYYDGRPWGMPIPAMLRTVCRLHDSLPLGHNVWVTEHGRTPKGTPEDPNWKRNWSQTADMGAAISVADMTIALTQYSNIQGTMSHSLVGSGPWPMFHRTTVPGHLLPSAVLLSLRLMRESMGDIVLVSASQSGNTSGYEGGYDVRGTVFVNAAHDTYSAWLVNRGAATDISLQIPAMASHKCDARQASLSSHDETADNANGEMRIMPVNRTIRVDFDSDGKARIALPEHSVVTVKMVPMEACTR